MRSDNLLSLPSFAGAVRFPNHCSLPRSDSTPGNGYEFGRAKTHLRLFITKTPWNIETKSRFNFIEVDPLSQIWAWWESKKDMIATWQTKYIAWAVPPQRSTVRPNLHFFGYVSNASETLNFFLFITSQFKSRGDKFFGSDSKDVSHISYYLLVCWIVCQVLVDRTHRLPWIVVAECPDVSMRTVFRNFPYCWCWSTLMSSGSFWAMQMSRRKGLIRMRLHQSILQIWFSRYAIWF